METFSALLALCAGNSPVTGEFPSQRPVTRSFDIFFDLSLNKRLSKQCEAGHLRRHRAHFHVIVMMCAILQVSLCRYALNNTVVITGLEQNDSENLLLIRPTGIYFSEIWIKNCYQ